MSTLRLTILTGFCIAIAGACTQPPAETATEPPVVDAREVLIERGNRFELDTPYSPPPGDINAHYTMGFARTLCSGVFVTGLDEERLAADQLRLDAVVRNLEVIGEAVKQLPEEITQQQSHVEWRKIGSLRDILIHHYFGIDVGIIWDVVQNKLPDFERQIRTIPENLDDG